jgi:hypothetical protein
MDPQEQLFGLIEAAEAQQKAAAAAVAGLAQERRELAAATEALRKASGAVQKAAGDAAAGAVTESIGDAPKAAERAVNQAVGALDEAAAKVRNAGAAVSFKIAAAVALVGVLTLLVFMGIGRWWISRDLQEIRDLQAEKVQLQAAVDDLAKRGGRAKLTTCGGRLCIEASSNQGEGYEQWASPWKAQNGASMVILRGY